MRVYLAKHSRAAPGGARPAEPLSHRTWTSARFEREADLAAGHIHVCPRESAARSRTSTAVFRDRTFDRSPAPPDALTHQKCARRGVR